MRIKGRFIKVETTRGRIIRVDISNKACLKFGFVHGDRVVNPYGKKCTILGVARSSDDSKKGIKVLWYARDEDGGKACYWCGKRFYTFLPGEDFEKIRA